LPCGHLQLPKDVVVQTSPDETETNTVSTCPQHINRARGIIYAKDKPTDQQLLLKD
jgi:hypothetical protein